MRLAFVQLFHRATGKNLHTACFDPKVRPQSDPKEEIMHSFPLNREISLLNIKKGNPLMY